MEHKLYIKELFKLGNINVKELMFCYGGPNIKMSIIWIYNKERKQAD
jgi:hypothetical protein